MLYVRRGQLVFGWDQLENFLNITRDRPVGNKVTSSLQNINVEYRTCRYRVPSP